MRPALALPLALLLPFAVAAGASSCTTETTAAVVTGCSPSTLKPCLQIVNPAQDGCQEVSAGADAYVPITVRTPSFLVRPPGTCDTCGNCGFLRLLMNGSEIKRSAASVIDLDFAGVIASPEGEVELTVELLGDDGQPFIWYLPDAGNFHDTTCPDQKPGQPITATVKFRTAKSCSTDAGTSSDAGDAG
jgi:hypothetical protein